MNSPTTEIIFDENLKVLTGMPSESVNLIYVDPPFNTQKVQARKRLKTTRAADGGGDRIGFKGQSYKTEVLGEQSYSDIHEDYLGFLRERVEQTYRILAPNGSFFFSSRLSRDSLREGNV
jgi:site-specific DNA-methyltransferase (adenine-specific)